MMRMTGYWMERGHDPKKLCSLSNDDRLLYMAIAELNAEQRKKELTEAVYNAVIMCWNEINKGR